MEMVACTVSVPDAQTMERLRRHLWPNLPLTDVLGDVCALLAHAPRVAQDLLDIHALEPRQRIERLISVCALALKDRPHMAERLRRMVPALAQEKLRRNGVDPLAGGFVLPKIQSEKMNSHVEIA